jgi:hypothetical protein
MRSRVRAEREGGTAFGAGVGADVKTGGAAVGFFGAVDMGKCYYAWTPLHEQIEFNLGPGLTCGDRAAALHPGKG